MGNTGKDNRIRSRIWQEVAEPDNPFATRVARCHGFDVYGDMLGNARWAEMIYLVFRGDRPSRKAAELLEALAVALANPGPRDPSVHAAMCGGTGGSPAAASLMAALAVGAGQLCGGREIRLALQGWAECGMKLEGWQAWLSTPVAADEASPWGRPEHPPGFEPHGVTTALPVKQALSCFSRLSPGPHLPWLLAYRGELESAAGLPLGLSGVAAAAYVDLGFLPEQAEMLHLILRLPGAAAHALEQWEYGYRKFPFYANEFETAMPEPPKEPLP